MPPIRSVYTVADRDRQALEHLDAAEHELRKALERMPNSVKSVYLSTDPEFVGRALRLVQSVSQGAHHALDSPK